MNLKTMEHHTEGMKRQAQDLIEQAYNRGYRAGQDLAAVKMRELIDRGIEQGRNEAWEVAKKLVPIEYRGCFVKYTASEAIEKIRAQEEQKKQEEVEEIRVGDEVIDKVNNRRGIVTYAPLGQDTLYTYVALSGAYTVDRKSLLRTGERFPEIVAVLRKMKSEEVIR